MKIKSCCPICGEPTQGEIKHYGATEYQCSKHFWIVGDLKPYAIRGAIQRALICLADIMEPSGARGVKR